MKERKKARLKDYLSVASPLGVTHLLFFSQSSHFHTTLRVGCVPRGPTLQFKVEKYTLMSQVRASHKRPVNLNALFNTSPLVVMDAFDMSKPEEKLITVTFQNLFPAINVATVKLADCKRVLLMRKDKESGCIEFRHYAILVKPAGLSRSVRSIVKARIPNLSKLADISEFVTGVAGLDPESEFEDESAQVELPDDFGGHNYKSSQSVVKLQEIGPRMSLRLIKVEQGFCAGEVLYHAFISKEAKEVEALRQKMNAKAALKEKRKALQETNVQRKQLEREEKLRARAERRAQKAAAADATLGDDEGDDEADDEGDDEGEGEDEGEGAAVKGGTDQPLAAAAPVGDAASSAATRAAELMKQQRTKKKEKRRKSSTVKLSGGIRLKRKRRE